MMKGIVIGLIFLLTVAFVSAVGTPVLEPKYKTHWQPEPLRLCNYSNSSYSNGTVFKYTKGYLHNTSVGIETCFPFTRRGSKAKINNRVSTTVLSNDTNVMGNTTTTNDTCTRRDERTILSSSSSQLNIKNHYPKLNLEIIPKAVYGQKQIT